MLMMVFIMILLIYLDTLQSATIIQKYITLELVQSYLDSCLYFSLVNTLN